MLRLQGKKSNLAALMMVAVDKNTFSLVGDLLALLDRAAGLAIQALPEDKQSDALTMRNAQVTSAVAECCPGWFTPAALCAASFSYKRLSSGLRAWPSRPCLRISSRMPSSSTKLRCAQ